MTFEVELRALLEKATPGPWEAEGVGGIQMDGTRDGYTILSATERRIASIHVVTTSRHARLADASLIAFQRNRASEVAAVVEAAREQHEQDCNCLCDCGNCNPPASPCALGAALEALATKEGSSRG